VTNSTIEIGIVNLLSGKKCKIINICLQGVCGRTEVWLIPLNRKEFTSDWLTANSTPAQFISKHKMVLVNCRPNACSIHLLTPTNNQLTPRPMPAVFCSKHKMVLVV
jgi:hypothetical protein